MFGAMFSLQTASTCQNGSEVQESTPICSTDADLRIRHTLTTVFHRRQSHPPLNSGSFQDAPRWRGGEECESSYSAECKDNENEISSETQPEYQCECLVLVRPALNASRSERLWSYPRYGSVLGVVSEEKPWENDGDGMVKDEDISSVESSSVDASSSCNSEDASGESEVQSKHDGALNNLSSLEDALPCKRGLSRFYAGKSRSYTCLSGVTSAKDIAKPLNPYAKRRRYFPYLDRTDRCQPAGLQDALCGTMRRKHGKVILSSNSAVQGNALEAKEKACFLVPSRSYSLTDLHARSLTSFGTLAGYSR